TAPNSIADTDLAASLLREAAQNVLDVHGDLSIAYGDVYRIRRDGVDLPASGADSDYGSYRVSWFDAQTDHTNTIYGGDSFVAVIEFGEELRAFGNLGYGNFDAQGTPSNTAALKSYSAGELRPLILDWDQIRENAIQSETINFKSAGNEK
ncbi:MAG: penicillin acylase family protein, partial [Pseudomonadota bacterium]